MLRRSFIVPESEASICRWHESITLSSGRHAAKKQAFYARVVELLNQRPKVRPEDVVIKLSEEPTGRLVVRKRRGPIHRATAGEVEVGRVGLRRDNPL
jgi:hypothetical protein